MDLANWKGKRQNIPSAMAEESSHHNQQPNSNRQTDADKGTLLQRRTCRRDLVAQDDPNRHSQENPYHQVAVEDAQPFEWRDFWLLSSIKIIPCTCIV